MKILSGDLNSKDVNCCCRCCNASFSLESREDFDVCWKYKPINVFQYDRNTMIPEYSIICPVCGCGIYVGLDPLDCDEDYNKALMRGMYADIIFNRKDWVERYKTEIKHIKEGGTKYV